MSGSIAAGRSRRSTRTSSRPTGSWRLAERRPSRAFSVYNVGSDDAITVRALADAICRELGLEDVGYGWTGGAGAGRGWAGDVRTMQLALERLKRTGWRPMKTSEEAVRAAARDVWSSIRKPRGA